MADQYVAFSVNHKADPGQTTRYGKGVAIISALVGFCAALCFFEKGDQRVVFFDGVTSLAVKPIKQVTQTARSVFPMQRAQTWNIMQQSSRAYNTEVEGATMKSNPSRRGFLAGLSVLPIVATAEKANAAYLRAFSFRPYFNYAGDLAVKGKVNVEDLGRPAGQRIGFDFTGVDPLCKDGPGEKANSCGVHIHKGTSCDEDALGHFYATFDDPWKTVTYTSKESSKGSWEAKGKDVKVLTDLIGADVSGRTFIVHDYEGKRVACAILG